MDSGVWLEIKDIFSAVLACAPSERAALLEARCAGRATIRSEVEALLEAHVQASGFLERPAVASAAWLLDTVGAAADRRRIGPFRLVERLGSGGMGVVHRAERVDGGFDQQVAIKIIDITLQDDEAMSRFRVERQILASLSHPNIVQFIDGGLTEEGQAFLVMELVAGVRLTDFCRDRALTLDARVQIFEQVCRAVQYAHQHGVVHRDLKPGNILVNDSGLVKVLDFGIAKMLVANDADATRTGMLRPLTPDYASPEQLRGLPVTTASDIYALGVLLYEIVAGQKPYETSHETLERVLELVTTTDPVRPSQMLHKTTRTLPYGSEPVRGDLDAIVMKAMQKEPAQRYASAQELADDLERYRRSEPVLARDPSLGYLLRKTARRHRAAAIAAVVSFVAVLAALGVSLWQNRRVAAERDRAQARFDDARQLANSLIFKVHDGIMPLAGATPVRKMIVAEALTYLERLSQDPSVDDALRLELANGYRKIGAVQGGLGEANLGDRAGARASYERAASLLQPIATRPGAGLRDVLALSSVENDLAAIYEAVGERAKATDSLASAIARLDGLLAAHPDNPEARSLLGACQQRMAFRVPRAEALKHFERSAELFEGLLQEKPDEPSRQRNVALTAKYMGARFETDGDLEKARRYFVRAMELDERRLAAFPLNRNSMFDVAIDIGNVANIDWKANRLKEAGEGFERSLALRLKLASLDPADVDARSRVAFMHTRLTNFYWAAKQPQRAIAHARKTVEVQEALASVDTDYRADFASALMTLGQVETGGGDRAAGCQAFKRSLTVFGQVQRSKVGLTEEQKKAIAELEGELKKCS